VHHPAKKKGNHDLHHELGHLYYDQPTTIPIFRTQRDGFHGSDQRTIVLAMTPASTQSAWSGETLMKQQGRHQMPRCNGLEGRVPAVRTDDRPRRWGVFDGSIKPDSFSKAWWDLKAKYRALHQ
jgi:peptidyl-dipeptidase A